MKKTICILLAAVLLLSVSAPCVYAGEKADIFREESRIPIVVVSGDGETLVDKDGNDLSKLSRLVDNDAASASELDDETVKESVLNIVKPFLIQGILTDNWEPYYEALQTEMTELFGDIVLDENGEPSNGSGLSEWRKNQMENTKHENRVNGSGYYTMGRNYQFYYDWRLDPCAIADELYDYINSIRTATGCDEVAIIARCLGSNVVCAYLTKYGTDGIHGVGFDGVACMGAEPISESISGKFKIDGYAIERILEDGEAFGVFSLDDFISDSIDLAVKSGLLDSVTDAVKFTVYRKIVKGVTSALTLAAISYPSYWACVSVDDFDEAVEYVFGEEGSEKRTKYAGLIEKITNYNETVKKNIPALLESLPETVNVGVVAKYGSQLIPVCESRDKIADTFVSLESSSFGATTGTVYEPLSDSYIAAQTKKGLGKYISPDGNVDASTCVYPDSTWFIKGERHSTWSYTENQLLYTVVTADRQLTVDDIDLTQFMVPVEEGSSYMTAMTVDNCDVENWDAQQDAEDQKNLFTKIKAFFASLMQWFRSLKAFMNKNQTETE